MTYNLNAKDSQILTELDLNARIPLTQLAKKVKLSVQVVKYRIEKLERDNIIQQYYAIVDVKKLGQVITVVYLKFQHLSTKDENEWIAQMNKHPQVMGLAKIAGDWDLTFVVMAKNHDEFNDIYLNICKGRKEKILKSTITTESKATYYNMALFDERINSPISTSVGNTFEKVDEIDHKLIMELSYNCRQTLMDLTKKVDLTANGIKDRIKQLVKKGIIIGYKTKINYEKLGYLHFRVMLQLKNPISSVTNSIQTYLSGLNNVESVNKYVGYDDLNFRCYVKSIHELHDMVSKLKDQFIEEIITTEYVLFFAWESMNYYLKE